MRLGSLAATKGGPAVANYGHVLEADHTNARAVAVAVASHYGITPAGDVLPEAGREYKKPEALSGNDFDKEFVSYMIEDHKSDISEFTREEQSNPPTDVKALAQNAQPVLQKHLDLANRLK